MEMIHERRREWVLERKENPDSKTVNK